MSPGSEPEGLDERERRNLEKLRSRMGAASITARAVGEALPEAVLISAGADQRLPKSLVETVERTIDLSVRRDPAALSAALYPVIGSAIRKAIEKLVNETLVKANAGLESAFSPRRFAWRMEAWRSGVPYFEIVLRNTLEYRVERAFLIHSRTGLLLAAAARPGSKIADEDAVASMLGAVRDYIKDSLALSKGESVNALSAGEHSVLVEEGPLASIAVVVRGTPDPSIRAVAQDALESVHLRFGEELAGFGGDVDPFADAVPILRRCLTSKEKGGGGKSPVFALALLGAIAAAAIGLAVLGAVAARRSGAFAAALEAEPGIVVVSARAKGRGAEIRLLRDPLARSVEEIAAARGVDLRDFSLQVEDYAALEPAFVLARLERLLRPPPTARLLYSEGLLTIEGEAPAAWREQALPLAYALAGVDRIAFADPEAPALEPQPRAPANAPAALAPRELPAVAREQAQRLAALVLLFDKDSGVLNPGQDGVVREARALALSIVALAREAGFEPAIEVIGHAAGEARDAESDRVSAARAAEAAALLKGADPSIAAYLSPRGAGNAEPVASEATEEGRAKNRSVTFRATFR